MWWHVVLVIDCPSTHSLPRVRDQVDIYGCCYVDFVNHSLGEKMLLLLLKTLIYPVGSRSDRPLKVSAEKIMSEVICSLSHTKKHFRNIIGTGKNYELNVREDCS